LGEGAFIIRDAANANAALVSRQQGLAVSKRNGIIIKRNNKAQ
jgi:hypothetical protein